MSPTSQVLQATQAATTKATWSRSPSRPTRPRWPRTSNRRSPCNQPAAGPRLGRDPEQQRSSHHQGRRTSAPYTHDAQGDDVYNDAGSISLGINSAVDATGATFENLQLGGAATVQVH
ncbi:immunoglobulin-like domain-containing protein [Pseudomonas monteilii]|uniref:immunoglobulin-like domain-containing protein n=1 Tax=Pseudomonas monteilii TaxID=76759 RepID=UPI003083F516